MAARISNNGLWRVSYGEIAVLPHEKVLARQPEKFKHIFPGNPGPDEYGLVNIGSYQSDGSLAADAANLCNPFGRLGLAGATVDVGGLFDRLAGIYEGKADDFILEDYTRIRREKYLAIVNPIPSENIRRIRSQNRETAMDNDEFLQMCKEAENDPDFAKVMLRSANAMGYDFTELHRENSAST